MCQKAGCIIWNDKKTVIFYNDDLDFTPDEDILDGDSPQAVEAVHGFSTLKGWTDTESLQLTTLMVPAPIVSYNMFIGYVGIVDQKPQCTSVKQKARYLSN